MATSTTAAAQTVVEKVAEATVVAARAAVAMELERKSREPKGGRFA
jgi:hypothetical protein